MTHLTFGPWDREHFDEVYNEVCIIQDIMNAHGYAISEEDVYKAWMAGGECVWEHPYDNYDDDATIVNEILFWCSRWFTDTEFPQQESEDYTLTDEEWESLLERLEDEEDDYEPKRNARREGFACEPVWTIH